MQAGIVQPGFVGLRVAVGQLLAECRDLLDRLRWRDRGVFEAISSVGTGGVDRGKCEEELAAGGPVQEGPDMQDIPGGQNLRSL